jgi:hypothetical protein
MVPETEVTEQTARELAMGRLLGALDGDPETRGSLRDLIAKKYPQSAPMMPETHVKQIIQPELEALRKERETLQKERQADQNAKNRAALHVKFQSLGVTRDEDIKELEGLMVSRGTADPDSLVAWWRQTKQVAIPGAPRSWGAQVPGRKGTPDFFIKSPYSGVSISEDMHTWRRERAAKDFADLDAGRPLDPVV